MKLAWRIIRFWFHCRGAIPGLVGIAFWWLTSYEPGAVQICGVLMLLEFAVKVFFWLHSFGWQNVPVNEIDVSIQPPGEYSGHGIVCSYKFTAKEEVYHGNCINPFLLDNVAEEDVECRVKEICSMSNVLYWLGNPDFCFLEKPAGKWFLGEAIRSSVIFGLFYFAFLNLLPRVS